MFFTHHHVLFLRNGIFLYLILTYFVTFMKWVEYLNWSTYIINLDSLSQVVLQFLHFYTVFDWILGRLFTYIIDWRGVLLIVGHHIVYFWGHFLLSSSYLFFLIKSINCIHYLKSFSWATILLFCMNLQHINININQITHRIRSRDLRTPSKPLRNHSSHSCTKLASSRWYLELPDSSTAPFLHAFQLALLPLPSTGCFSGCGLVEAHWRGVQQGSRGGFKGLFLRL